MVNIISKQMTTLGPIKIRFGGMNEFLNVIQHPSSQEKDLKGPYAILAEIEANVSDNKPFDTTQLINYDSEGICIFQLERINLDEYENTVLTFVFNGTAK